MNKNDIIELIKTGEGYTLEFKDSFNTSIGKTICALANASGGKIIMGVNDSGVINGINLDNRTISQIQDIARNMDPSLIVHIEKAEDLVVIHIPEGKDKPYAVNGHFYLRIGPNSQQLKRNEIRDFFQKHNLISFDKKANSEFNTTDDFNTNIFESFLMKASISKELPKEHVLQNLNLIIETRLNNAGVLFFCHKITKFFMNASVVCVLYQGAERVNILDKKEFDADFITNFDNAFTYVLAKLNTNFVIKGSKRVNLPELPEEALREAIINSMVHRDYFSQGHVQIDIFLDRVEISNPGGLLFDKKELGKVSLARNPILHDLMFRADYVEKVGSGINRIKKLVSEYGLKVSFKNTVDWFRIIFHRKATGKAGVKTVEKKVPEKVTVKVPEKVTENQRKILELFSQNKFMTIAEVALSVGISARKIKVNITKLKSKGLLKRIGPDKGGHWLVTSPKKKTKN